MNRNVRAVKDYLYATLQLQLNSKSWVQESELPFFLHNLYEFFEVSLLKQRCLFMIAKPNSELTPAVIKKHWELIQQKFPGLCVFIQESISAYNRKRLIEQHVPFIIPKTQIFLPDLGVDLREHFQKLRSRTIKSFSPATQAVIIHALVYGIKEQFTPSELAQKLHYSPMTMSRAFSELGEAEIGEIIHRGKERWWVYTGDKRQLWAQTLPLLKTPIKYKTGLYKEPPSSIKNMRAGASALSCQSMLDAPRRNVFAISAAKWSTLIQLGWAEVSEPDHADSVIEVWNYDPLLFAKNMMVDPFSLYLSLIADADERIELALEEMMEKIEW